jgi:hypothetical protein
MPGIGILSSIDYNADMKDRFEAGFKSIRPGGLPYIVTQEKIGYDTSKLAEAITAINNDINLKLNPSMIVTFGGFVASNAAVNGANLKFISLIGETPLDTVPPSGNFVGCCHLGSHLAMQNCIKFLLTAHPPTIGAPAKIGLLYNRNSATTTRDLACWRDAGGLATQAVSADNGYSNPNEFGKDFSQFSSGTEAIVVSADPHFNRYKNDLIMAANRAGKYMAYPFSSYRNRNGTRPSGNGGIYGIDLHEAGSTTCAYYKMGVMAATVFGGDTPTPAILKIQDPGTFTPP